MIMLKKIVNVALLSFLVGSGTVSAKSITPDLAKTVAVNFFKAGNQPDKTVREVVEKYAGGILTGYVVNFNEGGWVMVSANDVIEPIICFNFTGLYSIKKELEEENPMLEVFAEGIKEESTSLKSADRKVKEKWNLFSGKSLYNGNSLKSIESYKVNTSYPIKVEMVSPFLKKMNWDSGKEENIEWNQYRPYNDQCPLKSCSVTSNKRTPAGCTAIGVSQIVYWGHMKEHDFDWGNMPTSQVTTSSDRTTEMSKAIRKIADDLQTEYTCNNSSAYLQFAPPILYRYGFFWTSPYLVKGYLDSQTKQYVQCWNTSEWIELMKSELAYHKPILADGFKLNKTGGHTFIVCGYAQMSGQTYFYCNMGQQDTGLNCYYNFANNESNYISNNTMKGMYIGLDHYKFISNYNYAEVTSVSTNGITIKERCASNYLLVVKRNGTVVERTAGCLPQTEHQYADYTHVIKPKNTPLGTDHFYLVIFGQNGTRYINGTFNSNKTNKESIEYSTWPTELVNAVGGYDYKAVANDLKRAGETDLANSLLEAHLKMNSDAEEDILAETEISVKVSPNPNHGQFSIAIDGLETDASIVVTDALGNTIKTYHQVKESVDIDLGDVVPGMYFVRVTSAEFSKVEKIIVR